MKYDVYIPNYGKKYHRIAGPVKTLYGIKIKYPFVAASSMDTKIDCKNCNRKG